jgi:hypothetical protein
LKKLTLLIAIIIIIEAKYIGGYNIKPRTNLNYADLSNAELMGRNISFSNIKYATFSSAIMMGTKLNYSNLAYTLFDNAYLVKASFRGADLSHVRFDYADLRGANLEKSVLAGTSFKEANLEGAIWVNGKACQEGSIGRCVQIDAPIIADYEQDYDFRKDKAPKILLPYYHDIETPKTPSLY